MKVTTTALSTLLTFAALAGLSTAQNPTIPQMAKLHAASESGPLYLTHTDEVIEMTLTQLVRESALICDGTLRLRNTYLGSDQRWLYSDYEVQSARIVFRRSNPLSGQTPHRLSLGSLADVQVIDGVEVVAEETQFPLLPTDVPLVLFLQFIDKETKYRIVGGNGAFTITDSIVLPWLKTARSEPLDQAQFMRDVHAELDALAIKR